MATYSVRCADCGHSGTFLDMVGHSHPSVPAIGDTSQGVGELAGGDVQALPRTHRPRTRKGNRHDQRTPLPGDPGFVRPSLTADVLRSMLDE